MLSEEQLELIESQNIIALSTSSTDGQAHTIFVEASIAKSDSIIITDNHMVKTLSNIEENNKVFLLAYSGNYRTILNITGAAVYHDSGELLETIKNLLSNATEQPKGAVEVRIANVEEHNSNEDF
jgi:predicted pyridoxine 5'-phosphate oxidase superfamily flavin-nucleotide-binding protein